MRERNTKMEAFNSLKAREVKHYNGTAFHVSLTSFYRVFCVLQEELLKIKNGTLLPKKQKPKKQNEVVKREAFDKYLKIFYNRFVKTL